MDTATPRFDTARPRGKHQGVMVLLMAAIGIIYLGSLGVMLSRTTVKQEETTASIPVDAGKKNAALSIPMQDSVVVTADDPTKGNKISTENKGTHDVDVSAAKENSTTVSMTQRPDADKQRQETTSNITSNSTLDTSSIPWPGQVNHVADSLNRVVILIATCPYLDMLDNVIGSMKKVNVTNFVVVPLDDTTLTVSSQLYPNHVVPIPPNIKIQSGLGPATFGSKEFQTLTASRPVILSAFLKLNYTVFYCDTDTVWQSNPLDFLEESSNEQDLVAMIDNPFPKPDGELCSCYLYFKPTNKSFTLLDRWRELIATKRFQHDQVAFHKAYMTLRNTTSIRLYEPDNPYFPNGNNYFNNFNMTQRSQVMMIHNNFVFGYDTKKARFIEHDLWHPTAVLKAMEYTC